MSELDDRILRELKGKNLSAKQLTERLNSTPERIAVRMKQLRKWNMVVCKRVKTKSTGRVPLVYTVSE